MRHETDVPFTIIDLEQDTDAWHAWRGGGLGASDAPVIMGENPWKSAQKLRSEREVSGKPRSRDVGISRAMARGIELEPEARRAYNTLTGHQVKPACIQNNARDWMRCSLDGICFDSGVAVEIKCGYSAYRSTAKRQKVPRHYYGQVQHTLAVTGFDRMHFFCYMPGQRPEMVDCDRDERYIEKLIEREERFWNSLNRV